ncbi:hypothetical protein MJO28_009122 [Puccinia striiformis f. sp. tritici]|uniref:Uncharacterized protein n=1 Tax=Puccinia striiformis f. sp. tritici TaxID=168172 RepID=A0ACC0E9E9_9BASI|nr:hypothetical protein MJO28_009122 [Puccinia striiformis f. sp. tritici]
MGNLSPTLFRFSTSATTSGQIKFPCFAFHRSLKTSHPPSDPKFHPGNHVRILGLSREIHESSSFEPFEDKPPTTV